MALTPLNPETLTALGGTEPLLVVPEHVSSADLPKGVGLLPPDSPDGMDLKVYCRCMSRTNIDLDDGAVETVMRRYHFATKRDAVNFALRTVAGEPISIEEALAVRGSGWGGDLDEMREPRVT